MDQQQHKPEEALKQSSDADPNVGTTSSSSRIPSDGDGSTAAVAAHDLPSPPPNRDQSAATASHSNGANQNGSAQQGASSNDNRVQNEANGPVKKMTPPAAPPGSQNLAEAAAAAPSNMPPALLQAEQQQQQQRKGIPHVYRDFSNVPDSVGVVRKKTGGVAQPFPEKLHNMLNVESEAHPQAVSWLPHGRAFIVRDPHEFTDYIMHRYFRQTKLTSFQRQLNLYGFRRLTQGPDSGAYYHELFLRGRPQLCLRMQRQKVKGTGHKQPADVQTEPNFYNMSPSKAPESAPSPAYSPDQQQHSHPLAATSSVAASASVPVSARPRSLSEDLSSPGLGGVHGAAEVLKGLASGMRFSLGRPAASQAPRPPPPPATDQSALQQQKPPPTTTTTSSAPRAAAVSTSSLSDVFGSQQSGPSLSLLGRVTNVAESAAAPQGAAAAAAPSAFFWPPRKTTASALVQPSPGLEAALEGKDPPPIAGATTDANTDTPKEGKSTQAASTAKDAAETNTTATKLPNQHENTLNVAKGIKTEES